MTCCAAGSWSPLTGAIWSCTGIPARALQFTVLPQGLSHPLVIRVHSGGRELARAEVDLRTRFAAERLLLVLSRDADLDYLNDRAVDGLRVLYPHPELLPVHWRGYDAVAAMVLHGVSLERLSASQFDALHKWIAQGGILAVSGGADYALLANPAPGCAPARPAPGNDAHGCRGAPAGLFRLPGRLAPRLRQSARRLPRARASARGRGRAHRGARARTRSGALPDLRRGGSSVRSLGRHARAVAGQLAPAATDGSASAWRKLRSKARSRP